MEQKQASHSLAAKKAPKNMIRNKVARVWPRVAAVSGEPSESHATCSFAVNERASRRGMKMPLPSDEPAESTTKLVLGKSWVE